MTHLVLGDEGFPFSVVLDAFQWSPSAPVMQANWKTFARALEIDAVTIDKLDNNILLDKKDKVDVIEQLLFCWRSVKGPKATLGTLLKLVHEKCKWGDLAEVLREHARNKAQKWNELDNESQMVVMKRPVHFLGRNTTLQKIGNVVGMDKMEEILNRSMDQNILTTALGDNPSALTKCEHQESLPYYVERTLAIQHELDSNIFKAKCSDIFVVEGLRRSQLSPLVPGGRTGSSGSQIQNQTVRFIILECEDDFVKLSQKSRESIHRIACRDNRYFWLSTVGSVRVIQKHLKNSMQEIEEADMISKTLAVFNSRPIAISAVPGMGKTTLISRIAKQVRRCYPGRYVQTISLSKLLSPSGEAAITEEMSTLSDVKRQLSKCLTSNQVGEDILFELLNVKTTEFELFLDAYDEIPLAQLPLVNKMLELLLNSRNVRAFITTRSYLRDDLQENLGVIGWDIRPFSKEDQVNFFVRYWTDALGEDKDGRLRQFALACVEYFQQNDLISTDKDDSDNSIAGVPLQCFMLARIYLEEARRYLTTFTNKFEITLGIHSLTEMYRKFVEFRFKSVPDSEQEVVRRFHWVAAVKLLFPDWLDKLKDVLNLDGFNHGSEMLLTIGLLQSVSPVHFVHRTFAEYFVADFVVSNVSKNSEMAEFFFDGILSSNQSPGDKIVFSRNFTSTFMDIVQSVYDGPKIQWAYKKMVSALSMELVPTVDKEFRELKQFRVLLEQWALEAVDASFPALINILRNKLMWSPHFIAAILQIPGPTTADYQHPTICHFIDALLLSGNKEGSLDFDVMAKELLKKSQNYVVSLSRNQPLSTAQHFMKNFDKCIYRGHVNLFRFLAAVFVHAGSILVPPTEPCIDYLFQALQGEASLFEAICEYLKRIYGEESFQLAILNRISDLLYEAVKNGNYGMVEYLFGKHQFKFDFKMMMEGCINNSWKNCLPMIQRKIEIIRLLLNKRNNYISIANTSADCNPNGTNHIKLNIRLVHSKIVRYLIKLEDDSGHAIFDPASLFFNNMYGILPEDMDKIVAFLVEKQLLGPILESGNYLSIHNYVWKNKTKLKPETKIYLGHCQKSACEIL